MVEKVQQRLFANKTARLCIHHQQSIKTQNVLRVRIQQLNNEVKSNAILTLHNSGYTFGEPREFLRFSADYSDF